MEENIVIGIEGLVGAGKTSICRELLNYIPNSVILHGGNLYRAIVYAILQSGNNITQLKDKLANVDIKAVMDLYDIKIEVENKETVIYLKGQKIDEEDLQSKETSTGVSIVGNVVDHKHMFVFAKNIIDKLKLTNNVIVSGRALMDIYPELNYHFFITATLDERARRKAIQYNEQLDINKLKEHIKQRDEIQEQSGFYKKSNITQTIDVTDCENATQSALKVLSSINLK